MDIHLKMVRSGARQLAAGLFLCLFYLLEYFYKYCWMVFGEGSQNFSVEGNVFLFERANEGAVFHAVIAEEGIDASRPELAHVVLFVAAVSKGV